VFPGGQVGLVAVVLVEPVDVEVLVVVPP